MKIKATILNQDDIKRTITRLSHEIIEKHKGVENVILIGIRTRGEFLCKRIHEKIKEIEGIELEMGILDTTLYRDDFRTRLKQPEVSVSNITVDINDKDIILIDDVFYTGRTARSSLDALMDLGRPRSVQFCVLVDRGHRQLPLIADYVGKNIPTSINEEVKVRFAELDEEDAVYLIEAEN